MRTQPPTERPHEPVAPTTYEDTMLEIDRLDRETITVLALKGHLDALNAPHLKRETEGLVSQARTQVVFDMSELELIDSSGVGAIVSLFKQVRTHHGDVKIAALQGQPREIFKLLRLDRAFDLADDVTTAVSRFGS